MYKAIVDGVGEVLVSIERISPQVAAAMLETLRCDRASSYDKLLHAMSNGKWVLNGSTIVFSNQGHLLDGAARLRACVESGVSFDTFVVRGVDEDALDTIDAFQRRTLSDNLKMRGNEAPGYLAKIGQRLMAGDLCGGLESACKTAPPQFSTDDYVSYIEDNVERIMSLKQVSGRLHRRYRGVTDTCFAVTLDAIGPIDDPDIIEFVDQLLEVSSQRQPVEMLSKRLDDERSLIRGTSNRDRTPMRELAALMVKAWNAYIDGEEIKTLRFRTGGSRPEGFPEIRHID